MDDTTDNGARPARWSHWATMAWAEDQRTGSPGRKAVLMTLAGYADENDTCYPSQATLADATEQSPSTVHRCLEELEAQGLIVRSPRYDENGRRTSDRFQLMTPPVKLTGTPPVKLTPDSQRERKRLSSDLKANGETIPPIAEVRTGTTPYPQCFEAAWKAYPKRPNNSKVAAYRAWHARVTQAHRDSIPLENRTWALTVSSQNYARYIEHEGIEPQYVKHAATFWGPDDHWKPFVKWKPEVAD